MYSIWCDGLVVMAGDFSSGGRGFESWWRQASFTLYICSANTRDNGRNKKLKCSVQLPLGTGSQCHLSEQSGMLTTLLAGVIFIFFFLRKIGTLLLIGYIFMSPILKNRRILQPAREAHGLQSFYFKKNHRDLNNEYFVLKTFRNLPFASKNNCQK